MKRRRFLYSEVVRSYGFDDIVGVARNGSTLALVPGHGRRITLVTFPSIDRRHARRGYPLADAQIRLHEWQAQRMSDTVVGLLNHGEELDWEDRADD